MKKNEIKKRIIAFAAAAVLAITVYAPEAAFATEDQEAQAPETTQSSELAEKPAPEPAAEPEPAPAPAGEGGSNKLSNTQALDSFNSLPESVRRMVMDADSEDSY